MAIGLDETAINGTRQKYSGIDIPEAFAEPTEAPAIAPPKSATETQWDRIVAAVGEEDAYKQLGAAGYAEWSEVPKDKRAALEAAIVAEVAK
jgi:hypothetical protein